MVSVYDFQDEGYKLYGGGEAGYAKRDVFSE